MVRLVLLTNLFASLCCLWGCHRPGLPLIHENPGSESVLVEGGVFTSAGEEHSVASLLIDRTEVTVAAYRECVVAGKCRAVVADGVNDGWCNCHVDGRENYPMTCVGVGHALDFCAWKGKRLPTEWEWEWVARGRSDGRSFPWGEAEPSCANTVMVDQASSQPFGCGRGNSWPVGSKPLGASRDGVLDLVGNVGELVLGTEGATFSSRGGSYTAVLPQQLTSSRRREPTPFFEVFPFSGESHETGFRCVGEARTVRGSAQ